MILTRFGVAELPIRWYYLWYRKGSLPMPRKKKTEQPESATQLMRAVRKATRKKYSPEEKIRIVLEGLRGDQTVAALCRQEGIHANIYYKWMKEFMEAGKARLKGEQTRGATKGEVEKLKQENAQLREAVADLTVEARTLKKSLF